MNRTVQENINPTGSIIIWHTTGVDIMLNMCQSKIVVVDVQVEYSILGISKIRINHIRSLATEEIGIWGFIIISSYK